MVRNETIDATEAGTAIVHESDDFPDVDTATRLQRLSKIAGAVLPAAALAACGGGGDSGGGGGGAIAAPPTTPTPPPVVVVPPTTAEASRFLGQSSMGATRAEIDVVVANGYDSWINTQFATPRATTFWDWLVAGGYNAAANINGQNGFDAAVWRQLISGQDQLRQRVGMALGNMIVVGIDGLNTNWRAFAQAAFMDVLWDNAFGNYRDILEKVTLNPAMGYWLTYIGNRKANAATGAQPDENYAREVMQLFTIGLFRLNVDGTNTTNPPTESYGQEDVSQLARVFTGYQLDTNDSSTPDRLRRPLVNNAANYETGAKTIPTLGVTIPAGTASGEALRLAIDGLFNHANVGPFVGKQLIQRLVTSNPSPAYVGRVAAAFNNNGSGVRGDMKAVVRAILTDSEARSAAGLSNPNFGAIREPVMRLTGWARAFDVTSASDAWAIGNTSSAVNRLAQSPGRSPSVFNFFRPGYVPPNTAIASAGLVAPELQITNEPSVVAYINYMQALIQSGTGDVRANYTAILTQAADSAALVNEVNLLMTGGQLSSATVATIRSAVDSIGTTTPALLGNRVYSAILLTMASPDYLQRR